MRLRHGESFEVFDSFGEKLFAMHFPDKSAEARRMEEETRRGVECRDAFYVRDEDSNEDQTSLSRHTELD